MSNQQTINQFFAQFNQKLEQAQQQLPDLVGTEVVNHALENFKNESFETSKWPARKDKKNTRKLLIKSGALRRSVSIISTGHNSVIVGSDLPYAAVHNNGGTINRAARSETFVRNRHKTGKKGKMFGGMGAFKRGITPGRGQTYKAYSTTMPQRKFLGATPKLKEQLEKVIKEELKNAFK